MTNKLTTNELLRLACYYAEEYQASFLDAMRHCTSPEDLEAIARTEEFIEQLQKYRARRWGSATKAKEVKGLSMDDARQLKEMPAMSNDSIQRDSRSGVAYDNTQASQRKYRLRDPVHPETVVRWFLDTHHYWFDETLGPNQFTGMRDDAFRYLCGWIESGCLPPARTILENYVAMKFQEWLDSSWDE